MHASTVRHDSVPRQRETDSDSLVRRTLIALGLLGIALIHLLDLPGQFPDAYLIGIGYLLVIVASMAMVELIIRRSGRRFLQAAAVIALAPLLGYVLSRTVGLPQDGGDIGNWLQPLGLSSLFVEGTVILLSLPVWWPAMTASRVPDTGSGRLDDA